MDSDYKSEMIQAGDALRNAAVTESTAGQIITISAVIGWLAARAGISLIELAEHQRQTEAETLEAAQANDEKARQNYLGLKDLIAQKRAEAGL